MTLQRLFILLGQRYIMLAAGYNAMTADMVIVLGGGVGVLAFLFYIPMTFVIPSSSGLAAATMPVLAPVAELVGLIVSP